MLALFSCHGRSIMLSSRGTSSIFFSEFMSFVHLEVVNVMFPRRCSHICFGVFLCAHVQFPAIFYPPQPHLCVFPVESRASGKRSRPKSAFVVRDDERAATSPTRRPTSSSIHRGGSVNTHDPSRARPLTAYPSSQPHHYSPTTVPTPPQPP